MIRWKKQFVITLISVCMLTPLLFADSSKYEMKLQFEIDTKSSQSWLGAQHGTSGQGPVKPTHVALFHIRRPHVDMPSGLHGILQILKTPTGQSLSQQQQKFMTASDAITWWGIDAIKNHDTVFLYAVSQEDAKKMVQAYFEIHAKDVNARIQEYEQYKKDRQQEIIEIKDVLPEKQKQAEELEPKYMELKKTRYFSLSDDEAYETAKETMLEMDKMLDILKIDLAGINVKLSSIEQYRRTRRFPAKRFSDELVDKLDQMLIEQMIELKSAEARENAAIKIRERDKTFVDLFIQWKNLSAEVFKLKANLENAEKQVTDMEERLTNPEPYMQPPELYQNKVTIYPVLAE
jgi:hypothetical protein